MKLKRGPSEFWATLHRMRFVRGRMPFWRVVVEAKLNRSVRNWPAHLDGAVTAVFVWAKTIEEAEGLAALALEQEGLDMVTADAVKCPPSAPPRRKATAMARSSLGFLSRTESDSNVEPPSRRGARA